jgi:hypothetical protein
MTTVSHSSLTGADLHEPKGAASAASGTVYVANGSGSGTWTTLSALTGDVGEVKAFSTPIVPSGFLECDGSAVSRTTYANLFNAITIQQTGSSNNGVATITGLSDTSNMKAGYYIGGSGITNGTTILTVDSPTQVTMSAVATSTGSSTVIISPQALGNGSTTFTLLNFTDTGRFPRSRTSSVQMGTYQSNLIKNHVHPFTTASDGGGGATGTESATHTHNGVSSSGTFLQLGATSQPVVNGTQATSTESATHTHTIPNHAHAGTTDNNTSGGSETRPETISLLYCVRY